LTKTLPYYRIFITIISITGTSLFQRTPEELLQNINSNMEMAKQGRNLHRISLRRKHPEE
jgi:hypothetical protein